MPYDVQDIQSIAYRYLEDEAPAGEWLEACPGVRIMWGRSGHLAGAVWYAVEMEGKRLFFSEITAANLSFLLPMRQTWVLGRGCMTCLNGSQSPI